ncbi:hypothetical protein CO057_01685 [Candidatus Uhrbacteria bacterium CG_4_9_14_0_2_um_filter_41_50]|uniref:FCP1 homology domain-containing protein n=1 Tax=Candidatus Uhrbacteria bacterium CG_4_9_14_0_2_um_filter_41_50 TaxID=1975031 RepID=A0A2M8EPG6_9BACT|nr:MAG: hypothetical protein COZ45_00865 [Candidatus Uhrbacteria bacterium CG_4_10_14_3_um_filter_41_21]PIZ55409.1 MAG: hypothetical protein COY24_00370 [Candidatus Uhrbacteria bacterium CG_4_10_14_0_2_um_filter_41_21]PJB85079.1 MAG: hypothetical protein CO086_00185 [Candidatus Uhrbacteria bacterium CG_4_9_14_0_8_um_filter_41_16]PJC24640.1 MAG: hypothetical protein CO057_01685 [Candidatus Uhrbacteria bacterium CG_4_9_14_0_2_um_filter_41_50]PJE75182.1 MAG: hypothetical protein COV03_01425 [Candi
MDGTQIDTNKYIQDLLIWIARRGHKMEGVVSSYNILRRSGYSIKNHLIFLGESVNTARMGEKEAEKYFADFSKYIFSDVEPILKRIQNLGFCLYLLTFGDEEFQKAKWQKLHLLHPFFEKTFFAHKGQSKGEIFVRETSSDQVVYFIDDDENWLSQVKEMAPWVNGVQINRCDSQLATGSSNGWPIIGSFEELIKLILERGV